MIKSAAYRLKNRDRNNAYQRQHHAKQKRTIIDYYGGNCVCCGEDTIEFLTVDHINGGGTKHRKRLGGGARLYRWIVKNKFPPGYQTLCMNCNLGKHLGNGTCPHKKLNI